MHSLHEIEQHWSIHDLLDANIALDLWDEMERKAYKKAERDARAKNPQR